MKKRTVWLMASVIMLCAVALSALPGVALAASQTAELPQAPLQAVAYCSYTVRSGDTLYGIAVRSGTTVYALAALNGLYNANLIYSGMGLRVPCSGGVPAPVPVPSRICTYYLVRPGDTLQQIAGRFGTTWQAIAQANHLYSPNVIYWGMRLGIPCTPAPVPFPSQWKTFVSPKHHFTINYPANWSAVVQGTVPSGTGSDPEGLNLHPAGATLPVVQIYVQRGAPPVTGYENCNKNLQIQGIPVCSISEPGAPVSQKLLIFQRGQSYFYIDVRYSEQQQLAIFEEIVKSLRFTQ